LNAERFIADRIARSEQNKGNISRPIVKIGVTGIAIGVAVMLLTVSIVLGFKKEIVRKIAGLTADIVISNVNINASNEPEPLVISKDSLATIQGFAGIKHLQRTAFKNGLLKTEKENEGVLLKGVDSAYDFSFLQAHLQAGSLLHFSDSAASRDLLLSAELARKLGIQLNDRLMVYFLIQYEKLDSLTGESMVVTDQASRRLKVSGIFETGFSDYDRQLGIVDLRLLQVLNHWSPELCGSYEIQVQDFEKVDEGLEAVQEYLGYNYNVRSVRDIYSNIFVWLDKLDINGVIVVVLMILVATINMVTALLILMLERANMVGLVKAFGMSNRSVRRIFLKISFRLVGRGMLIGNAVGLFLCWLQYHFHLVGLDASTYYVKYVAIEWNWTYILLLNAGTVVACALMLFLPTLILTKMTPVKTLKFD
jgi:lipoprotein-releasing system permease protein